MKTLMSLVIAGCVFTFASCGGGGSSSSTAQIRFGNFVSDATSGAQILIDNTSQGTVSFGQTTSYMTVNSGSRTVELRNPTTSADFINQTPALTGGSQYLFLASGVMADQAGTLFTDTNTAPTTGNVNFRIINAMKSATSGFDVYITNTPNDLFSTVADSLALPYKSASGYISKPAGQYTLVIARPNAKTSFFYYGGSIAYSAGQIRTIVLYETASGSATAATLNDLN